MKRLLITGPRLWTDTNVISGALVDVRETWPQETIVLVSGNAVGFDRLTEHAAEAFGGWEIERHPVSADQWKTGGKGAGHARNARMTGLGADLCIAGAMACATRRCSQKGTHLTHGTANCSGLAMLAGIPVRWYSPGPVVPDVAPCERCELQRGCLPGACRTIGKVRA